MSSPPAPPDDDDTPAEIDFSGVMRGKFYRPDATLSLPVYLDADVQACLVAFASSDSGTPFLAASDLLKKEIAILEVAK